MSSRLWAASLCSYTITKKKKKKIYIYSIYALRAGGWKLFEFEDQGKVYLICPSGNMQVSFVASEGQY